MSANGLKAQAVRWMGLMMAMTAGGSGALAQSQNLLIIVADDVGVDFLECYGEGSTFPPTPTIHLLRETGILFRNAWGTPVCSPTRATIQTGRYGIRTGVGAVVPAGADEGLPFEEIIIPEVLDLNPSLGYAHAAIGKWHLTSQKQADDDGPNLSGYSHYSGTLYNLTDPGVDYFNWPKTENGETTTVHVYATTDNVNEAIEWINIQESNPWFMYLAFNAPHTPRHAPPDELHTYDLPPDASEVLMYQAMIEAMDTEIGRLFDSISPEVYANTNIIFLGDNGSPSQVTQPPFCPQHGKLHLYEGGVNVPLIISGPRVAAPNRESAELVNTVDLFSTSLELMGVDVKASLPSGTVIDSVSMVPIIENQPFEARTHVYSEKFNDDFPDKDTNNGRAIRNVAGYKLIRFFTHAEEFYELTTDPFEQTNLLLGELTPTQLAHFEELSTELDAILFSACEGDANRDGTVDPLDNGFVLARLGCLFGTGDGDCDAADVNHDGQVSPLDSGYILARFGTCPE